MLRPRSAKAARSSATFIFLGSTMVALVLLVSGARAPLVLSCWEPRRGERLVLAGGRRRKSRDVSLCTGRPQ